MSNFEGRYLGLERENNSFYVEDVRCSFPSYPTNEVDFPYVIVGSV